jgi:mono/diheme cytochrome c family protein
MKLPTIVRTCDACDGTGVLGKGPVVVVCAGCHGNGYVEQTYKPFSGQKKRDDVQRVRRSGGWLSAPANPKTVGISYKDFMKGKRP